MTAAIYLAGPIGQGPNMQRNILAAIDFAHEIREMGFIPFVPHLSWYWHHVRPRDYEDWMILDFEWIRRCDALFRMPGVSPGADREVVFARELGLPVFSDLAELRGWVKPLVSEARP